MLCEPAKLQKKVKNNIKKHLCYELFIHNGDGFVG